MKSGSKMNTQQLPHEKQPEKRISPESDTCDELKVGVTACNNEQTICTALALRLTISDLSVNVSVLNLNTQRQSVSWQ